MERFLCLSWTLGVLLYATAPVFAEEVTLPHDFQPNTPAKANEVNENFNAIVQALANLSSLVMYENNQVVGKSVLHNIFKLNSNYLTVAQSYSGDPNIYVGRAKGGGTLYFSNNDCTGNTYLSGAVFDIELYLGEAGYIFGVDGADEAYVGGLSTSEQIQTVNSVKFGTNCFPVQADIEVYPVQVNDPGTTGVTTAACMKGSKPRVCFSQANIVRE